MSMLKKNSLRRTYLGAPACPHVIIAPQRLPIAHETKVHGRPNQLPVEGQVHPTHGKQGSLHIHGCPSGHVIFWVPRVACDVSTGSSKKPALMGMTLPKP